VIIGVVNQKGGAGKTTVSINLADGLAREGYRVLIIDADPQGSSMRWQEQRSEAAAFTVLSLPSENLHREISKVATDYDFVVIDSAPRVDALGRAVIASSDVALIPIQPSGTDFWGSEETVDLIKQSRAMPMDNPPPRHARFLLNRMKRGTSSSRAAPIALDNLFADDGVGQCETQFGDRVIYSEAITAGTTVLEENTDRKASKEVRDLVAEIIELGGAVS